MSAPPVLEVRGLGKSYGKRAALRALELEVAAGELVALVGENGAGKTTSLAIISGQLVPDEGSAHIGGDDVFERARAARSRLGYVAQGLLLPPYLTVREMAQLTCRLKGVSLEPDALDAMLALTSLGEDADRLVGELSHGMQRKAAWVAALVSKPALLVLDEGLAGLDAASSAALAGEVLRRLDDGLAVLWAEHDLELLVERLTRVVVLHGGELAEVVTGDVLREEAAAGKLAERMRRWTSTSSSSSSSESSS
ncbi:MAG: ABC transporter ATP-binding protein [Myxococcales bacterium]|nr:ABC transporter ATP-binding protein [Myxococcales bacterium]